MAVFSSADSASCCSAHLPALLGEGYCKREGRSGSPAGAAAGARRTLASRRAHLVLCVMARCSSASTAACTGLDRLGQSPSSSSSSRQACAAHSASHVRPGACTARARATAHPNERVTLAQGKAKLCGLEGSQRQPRIGRHHAMIRAQHPAPGAQVSLPAVAEALQLHGRQRLCSCMASRGRRAFSPSAGPPASVARSSAQAPAAGAPSRVVGMACDAALQYLGGQTQGRSGPVRRNSAAAAQHDQHVQPQARQTSSGPQAAEALGSSACVPGAWPLRVTAMIPLRRQPGARLQQQSSLLLPRQGLHQRPLASAGGARARCRLAAPTPGAGRSPPGSTPGAGPGAAPRPPPLCALGRARTALPAAWALAWTVAAVRRCSTTSQSRSLAQAAAAAAVTPSPSRRRSQ